MNSGASPIHVFLAEDSPAIRERVSAMLGAQGIAVDGGAATPQACIDGILASRPDVVVLDGHLEGGTGLQVLDAVHAAAPEVSFVVFSNDPAPAYRRRYLAHGAAGFLDKSSEFHQLAAAVQSACKRPIQQPAR